MIKNIFNNFIYVSIILLGIIIILAYIYYSDSSEDIEVIIKKKEKDTNHYNNQNHYFQKANYKDERFYLFYDTLENRSAIYSPKYMYLSVNKSKNVKDTLNRVFIEGIFYQSNFTIYVDTVLIESKNLSSTTNYSPVAVRGVSNVKDTSYLNLKIDNHYIKTLWMIKKFKYLRIIYVDSTIHLVFTNKYPYYK